MSRTLVFSIYYTRFLILLLIILHVSAHGTDNDDDDAASESSTKPNLRARSLILVKIWCLVLVFLGTFIGGLSPCFFKWNQGFLALGTQFSGGVFLGTALMHFLSDANETFEDLTSKEYPFAFMLASAGYLLTMLADCVIAGVYKRDKEVKENSGSDHTQLNKNYGFVEGGGVASAAKIDNDHTQNQQQQVQPCGGGGGTTDNSSSDHPHVAAISTMGDTILLIVALCFHSIFEGIAIGVAETTADAWKALWTISLHKIFAAIAMSIALLKMIPHRPILTCGAYAFAFAISSPIGVAIGIVIDQTTEGRVADWVFAISMGLACGVFVYVSINHLLSKRYYETSKEQESGKVNSPYFRFLAVVLGVGVIAVVMIWDT